MNPLDGYTAIVSGLLAAQAEASTAGNNIANASNPNYADETVELVSAEGTPIPLASGDAGAGTFGGGVRVVGVVQQTDAAVTQSARQALANATSTDAYAKALTNAEGLLQEPSANGLMALMDTFFNNWTALSQDPSNTGARAAVVGSAQNVVAMFGTIAQGLSIQQTDTAAAAASSVQEDSQLVQQVASLNGQIQSSQMAGLAPNALLDQRSGLLDQLASDLGATATEVPTAQLTPSGEPLAKLEVTLPDGTVLVDGSTPASLTASSGPPAALTVTFGGTPTTVSLASGDGKVGALMALLNGQLSGDGSGAAPGSLLIGLDQVASALASQVNALQTTGYYAGTSGMTNTPPAPPLFTAASGTVTASNLAVNSAVSSNLNLLATATSPSANDGSNAAAIGALEESATGPTQQYNGFVTGVGEAVSTANQNSDVAQAVSAQAQQTRESVSGVNINQETANLAVDQQTYGALTKALATIQSMVETLLNSVA